MDRLELPPGRAGLPEVRQLELVPGLADLAGRLAGTRSGHWLNTLLATMLFDPPAPLTAAEHATALAPFQWFLDQADAGLVLTKAGYLRPDDVIALSRQLATMDGWIGKANREDLTPPVAQFRQMMTRLKLVRRHNGKLCATRAGTTAANDPGLLWRRLGDSLLAAARPRHVESEAWLLVLACHAASQQPHLGRIAQTLHEAGWANPDQTPPAPDTIRQTTMLLDAITDNLTPPDVVIGRFAYDTLTATTTPTG